MGKRAETILVASRTRAAYDHRGRMVSKRITENDGHDTLVKSTTYLWDGWNIIRETQWPVTSGQWSVGPLATNHYPLVTDYVWGLDLNGALQGAGGVGGLLAVLRSDCAATNSAFCILHSALYLPTYDANGNVSEYIDESGEVVAHYDYSPFGETLIESGNLASSFTHRFSTKPWCPITGLYEYQMRKYRPGIGRWLSRDPAEESGSVSMYRYALNAPVFNDDYVGYFDLSLSNPLFYSELFDRNANLKKLGLMAFLSIRSMHRSLIGLDQDSWLPAFLFTYYYGMGQCHLRISESDVGKLNSEPKLFSYGREFATPDARRNAFGVNKIIEEKKSRHRFEIIDSGLGNMTLGHFDVYYKGEVKNCAFDGEYKIKDEFRFNWDFNEGRSDWGELLARLFTIFGGSGIPVPVDSEWVHIHEEYKQK